MFFAHKAPGRLKLGLWAAICFWCPLAAQEPGYRVLRQDGVSVYCRDLDIKVAEQYLAWSLEFRARPAFLRARPLDSLRVFIAPTDTEFRRLGGGGLPEWGVACALPEQDLVIVRSPRLVPLWLEDPRDILNHEISHVFLDQQLRPAAIPHWFHEGFALYSAEMWDLGQSLELSVSLVTGAFFPLDSLAGSFPAQESRARLAYLQSYTVVDYMFSRWDGRALALLFRKWKQDRDLDQALRYTLGLTLFQFEQRWGEWARVRYGWLRLLTSVTLFWLLTSGLFIAVFVASRLRFHQRLKQMQAEEDRSVQCGAGEAQNGDEGSFEDNPPLPDDQEF